MIWLVPATACVSEALSQAITEHLEVKILEKQGVSPGIAMGTYALHCTGTAQEVSRTAPNPALHPDLRQTSGVRR